MTDDEALFDELKQPKNWAYMAAALQKAAATFDYTRPNADITDWRFLPIYRMLIGFSLENLIKGILVAEKHPCMEDGAKLNHGLAEYATRIVGVEITETDEVILADCESYVVWAGRYPRPQRQKGMIRIGHSWNQHDAELDLAQRLYDYLRSLCPDIEPSMFLLPQTN